MRFSPVTCSLIIAAICCVTPARAQEQASLQARLAARRDLALARIDLRNYWQIEYPRRRRDLNGAIEFAEAQIKAYDDQVLALRPYTSFSLGEPFPLTVLNLKMCRKEAQLRLDNLVAERNALIRFHGDDFQVLEIRVLEARMRVAALEENDVATNSPAAPPQQ